MDSTRGIAPEEFRARQNSARNTAQESGVDGLVVYSRGGAFMDMCADVLCITTHCSNRPDHERTMDYRDSSGAHSCSDTQ